MQFLEVGDEEALEGAQMILNLRGVPSGPWFFEESQSQGLQAGGRCAGEKRT